FAPELGSVVCGSLEMDPGYEAFWEPDVRELKAWALKAWVGAQRQPQAEREEVPTGPCWVCGLPATDRCDYRYDDSCRRWICDAHLVIEAQHWDTQGLDGVDVRCQEHRNLSINVRDWVRGNELPPAPRWEGAGDGLLTAY